MFFSLLALAIFFRWLGRVLHGPSGAVLRDDWNPDVMSEGWRSSQLLKVLPPKRARARVKLPVAAPARPTLRAVEPRRAAR